MKRLQETVLLLLIIMSSTLYAQRRGHVCYINGQQAIPQSANGNTSTYDANDVATRDLRDIQELYDNSTPNYSIRNTPLKSAWSYLNEDGNNLIYTIAVNRTYFENLFTEDEEKKAVLIFVIAHEYAHCRRADAMYSPDQSMYTNYNRELAADEQAGYAVAQLTNVDISFFDELDKVFNINKFNMTHPAPEYRILRAKYGWMTGKLKDASTRDTLKLPNCQLHKRVSNDGTQLFECFNSTDGLNNISADFNPDFGGFTCRQVFPTINQIHLIISSLWNQGNKNSNYVQLAEVDSTDTMNDYAGLQSFSDGNWYQGTWQNESLNEGTMHYKNKNVYNGLFKNEMRNGLGRMDYADGSNYIGGWVDNERSGKGVLYKGKIVINQGIWENDKFCQDCKE